MQLVKRFALFFLVGGSPLCRRLTNKLLLLLLLLLLFFKNGFEVVALF